jgi:hypothetical protein
MIRSQAWIWYPCRAEYQIAKEVMLNHASPDASTPKIEYRVNTDPSGQKCVEAIPGGSATSLHRKKGNKPCNS